MVPHAGLLPVLLQLMVERATALYHPPEQGVKLQTVPRHLLSRRHTPRVDDQYAPSLLLATSVVARKGGHRHRFPKFKLPSLGSLFKLPPPPPVLLPKPWRDTKIGMALNSEKPAGDSYPPKYLNYKGSVYARRFVKDRQATAAGPHVDDPLPGVPKNQSASRMSSSRSSGDADPPTFNPKFHALPSPDSLEYARARMRKPLPFERLNVGSVSVQVPLLVSTDNAE